MNFLKSDRKSICSVCVYNACVGLVRLSKTSKWAPKCTLLWLWARLFFYRGQVKWIVLLWVQYFYLIERQKLDFHAQVLASLFSIISSYFIKRKFNHFRMAAQCNGKYLNESIRIRCVVCIKFWNKTKWTLFFLPFVGNFKRFSLSSFVLLRSFQINPFQFLNQKTWRRQK